MHALEGKVAIVTGANQGLGLAIARQYLQAGVRGLAICARGEAQLHEAAEELRSRCATGQSLLVQTTDVSKEADVRRLVDDTHAAFGGLDILVNNAGVYGPKGCIDEVDWAEWTRAIEINLFGSILMCRAVLPIFRAQRRGKIVQLSGGGATNPLPRLTAYAASKAAIVRLIESIAEEVRGEGIEANAIAPGALNTRMLDEVLEAGPARVGEEFFARALKQQASGGASLERAAELAVFLASSQSDGITGKLISAAWDPWPSLADHMDDLASTDIYSLRRIVPADRGRTWGGPS